MTIEIGQPAVVSVATATLWTAPQQVDNLNAPALRAPSGVREWVASMDREQRVNGLNGKTLTQLLFNDEVVVEEIDGDWAKVVIPGQPAAKLGERGYPGWLPLAQLAEPATGGGDPYIVDATATSLRDEPDGDVSVAGVILSTRLTAVGAPYRGWVPVTVPGQSEPAWVRGHDLSPAGPRAELTGEAVLTVAARLLEVPYVWGGLSAYGVDCSGLVHLVHRYLGVTVPRDADDQSAACKPVDPEEASPGDLYFFAKEGRDIHHVGFVGAPDDNGDPTMLHASGVYGKVVHETFTGDRRATLIGAGAVEING
ncbi:peptidase P60 [Actinorhabdospora filicis]|uniref:Peptidase P60 n=1 Tax=Actinorhabdospora filicis TaxID=1785913 RepID=A0A9W6SMZ9_9ACTN|nr:NlpC/P60 family protein [Actinorhabdospora filicis]GLZ78958.1 peptidase P60 [Actinorhabdospora filicis]